MNSNNKTNFDSHMNSDDNDANANRDDSNSSKARERNESDSGNNNKISTCLLDINSSRSDILKQEIKLWCDHLKYA